jgi:predicted transcriptional regulator
MSELRQDPRGGDDVSRRQPPHEPAEPSTVVAVALIPLDARALDVIPPGVQPEVNGRLLCRLCGRWWRSLGHHLRGPKHRMAPAQYRETFELPATRALMATDLREAQAQRGSVLLETHPGIRAAFQVDQRDVPERAARLAKGRARKRSTQSRAGVQLGKQAVGEVLAQSSRRRSTLRRRELDELARSQGYAGLQQMAVDTATLSHAEFGELLGLQPGTARAWRRQLGVTSGVHAGRAAARRAHWKDGLEEIPAGVQPEENGALRCRVCGLWKIDLAQHVIGTHKISAQEYRSRFELAEDCPLRGAALRSQDAQLAHRSRAASALAGRAKSERARQGYDEQARRCGYADVVQLMQACATPEVMRLLGVSRPQAGRLRQRYVGSSAAATSEARRQCADEAKSSRNE